MTSSNASSGNGSLVASAVTGAAAAAGDAASPSARMAANMPRTGGSSPLSRSAATHVRPAAVGLEGVPARAAAEVEHAITRTYRKPREIDRQHAGSPLTTFR